MEAAAWVLTLFLFVLEVAGVVDVSWWVILLPLIIVYGLVIGLLGTLLGAEGAAESMHAFGRWRDKKSRAKWQKIMDEQEE